MKKSTQEIVRWARGRDTASRSPQLAADLGLYAAATSDVQRTMLDNIIGEWSATSTFFTTAARAATLVNGVSTTAITLEGITAGSAAYTAFMNELSMVERFNGQTFRPLPSDPATTLSYTILRTQQALIDQSYQVLKSSVLMACGRRRTPNPTSTRSHWALMPAASPWILAASMSRWMRSTSPMPKAH